MNRKNYDKIKNIIFSVCGLFPCRIFHYWRGNALVLLYHRVVPDEEIGTEFNPNSYSSVSCTNFKNHIAELSSNYKVVSINELYQHVVQESEDFVVSITFDDGYKDNLINALPILEKYGVPATFYITTRFPEGDTWMWWYELWDYLLGMDSVSTEFQGKTYKWTTSLSNEKFQCFKDLSNLIKLFQYNDQKSFSAAITKTATRKQYPQLCLNWDEIKKLDTHPLVTIGAHTHTHPALAMIPEEDAMAEMKLSKVLLEKKLGHLVESFAYPFGTKNDAGQREFNYAKICGFGTGLTTQPEPFASQGPHSIPRLGVPYFINVLGLRSKLSGCEYLVRKILKQNNNII